jgi:hypothetical protein
MNDNIVQSQLMMAQAVGSLAEALTATKTMQSSTRDAVIDLTVPTAVTAITVDGVTTAGDGQAGLYVRVAADPGAVEKVQSADGSWFELATPSSVTASGIVSSGSSISAATSVSAGTFINATTEYRVAGTKVIGARITGWGSPTGTQSRTTFSSATVTLPELAQRVGQLINDLKTHGLIGT